MALRADGRGWWRAEVGDQLVGRIRAPSSWGALTPASVMWTERYGPALQSCADIGHAVAWFGTPVADEGVMPLGHENFLAANAGCPGSSADDADGGVLHVMGAGR